MTSYYCSTNIARSASLMIKALSLVLMLLFIPPAQSQNFEEGRHYSVIEQAAFSKSTEVIEFFSFSCPGCYAMEPLVKSMQTALPELQLRRVHMPFGGRKAKQSQKVFALMALLNADDTEAVFERIHAQRNVFDNDAEVISYFVDLGYERLKVERLLESFSVDAKLRRMTKEGINKKIQSVPSFVVNGRYQINLATVSSADDFTRLIAYLAALPE